MARSSCGALALLGLLLLCGAARASLLGQTVAVTLTDGASLDATDSVLVGAGAEITPGDGSQIGDALLPNELVDIEIAQREARPQRSGRAKVDLPSPP